MTSGDRSPPESAAPQWQRTLVRWLGPAVCGIALNQIADVVPHFAVVVASVVLAIMFGLSKLHRTAPLVRGLPRVLLIVIAAGIVASVLMPASWTNPIIGSLTGLIVLSLLLTKERGTALATLIGISVFTYGVGLGFSAPHLPSNGFISVLLTLFAVCCSLALVVAGLCVLTHPERVIRSNGMTLATLCRLRQWHSGNGFGTLPTLGSVTMLVGALLTAHGPTAAGVLLMVIGFAVIGGEIVLWVHERHSPLFGVLLTVAGAALTALSGLIGFGSTGQQIVMLMVPILGTLGLAMVGGGLSLLDDAGTLPRLYRRVTQLTEPARPDIPEP